MIDNLVDELDGKDMIDSDLAKKKNKNLWLI